MGQIELRATGKDAKEVAVFAMNGYHSPDLEVQVVKRGQFKKSIIIYKWSLYPICEIVFDRGTWRMFGTNSLDSVRFWLNFVQPKSP